MIRRRRLSLALATVALACAGAAAPAEAKLKEFGRWVFTGADYNDEGLSDKNDPMTLLWKGGKWTDGSRRERISRIEEILNTDWTNGDMQRHPCLEGKHLGYYRAPSYTPDGTDLNMSTSDTCDNQWHTRTWNDREINDNYQWAVGGIHRETRCFVPAACHHEHSFSFETAEDKAIKALSRHCSVADWKALPGSGTRKRDNIYSNGRISRISMQRVDHSKPSGHKCDGAFR